jgi:ribose/xylose/arabinose/galactoside ABC-type transport system permease subunit
MAVDTDTPMVDVRSRLRQVPVQELVLPIVIVALIIIGMIIRPGIFLTSDNLLNVLTQASITGISPSA